MGRVPVTPRTNDHNQFENKVATYLDNWQLARLFFWYRNRARRNYFVQGWKSRRIYPDLIVALRDDEAGRTMTSTECSWSRPRAFTLKAAKDTEYKRSVFDICNERARRADWAEFAPELRSKVMRVGIVDEVEWQACVNRMLFCTRPRRWETNVIDTPAPMESAHVK